MSDAEERARLVGMIHQHFETFRRAVEERRAELIGPAWARVCRLRKRLIAITPADRVVG